MLFQDVDYGQWGLVILSPDQAAERTAWERSQRPEDFPFGDIVAGEFLGDLELLIATPRDDGSCQIRIALPLDPRGDWYVAAESLAEFLQRYLVARGDKYWEPHYRPQT